MQLIQLEKSRASAANCSSVSNWLSGDSSLLLDRFSSRNRYKRQFAFSALLSFIKLISQVPIPGFPILAAEVLNNLEKDSLTSLDEVAIKGERLDMIRSELCAMTLHRVVSRDRTVSINCPAIFVCSLLLLSEQTILRISNAELCLLIASNCSLVIPDEHPAPKYRLNRFLLAIRPCKYASSESTELRASEFEFSYKEGNTVPSHPGFNA